MKKIRLACVALVAASNLSLAMLDPKQPSRSPPSPTAASIDVGASQQDVDSLKKAIGEQSKEIAHLMGEIDLLTKQKQRGNTTLWAALGAVIAAFIAGAIALWNQNKQASQERLLKAVEIIMESRSGYQADNRRMNLEVFLDPTTKEHLKDIKTQFAGPEFTDLHIALAQAMSEKATTPEEVLKIWRAILKEKNVYNKISYPA